MTNRLRPILFLIFLSCIPCLNLVHSNQSEVHLAPERKSTWKRVTGAATVAATVALGAVSFPISASYQVTITCAPAVIYYVPTAAKWAWSKLPFGRKKKKQEHTCSCSHARCQSNVPSPQQMQSAQPVQQPVKQAQPVPQKFNFDQWAEEATHHAQLLVDSGEPLSMPDHLLCDLRVTGVESSAIEIDCWDENWQMLSESESDDAVVEYLDEQEFFANPYAASERWQARRIACETVQQENGCVNHHEFVLSEKTEQLLHEAGYQVKGYRSIEGNALQKTLHGELVCMVDSAATLRAAHRDSVQIVSMTDTAVDFGDLARAHNRAGNVFKTCVTLDFCFAVLNCAQAIVEGVVLGAFDTARAAMHPIDTAWGMVTGTVQMGYCFYRVVKEVFCIYGSYALGYTEESEKRFDQATEQVSLLYDAVQTKLATTSPRQLCQDASRFVTHQYLVIKGMACLGNVCKRAKSELSAYAERGREALACAEEPAFVTANPHCSMMNREASTATGGGGSGAPGVSAGGAAGRAIPVFAQKMFDAIQEEFRYLYPLFNKEIASVGEIVTNIGTKIKIRAIDLKHIFIPVLKKEFSKVKLNGFHHDWLSELGKATAIELRNVVRHASGAFRTDVKFAGIWEEGKTFFPPSWSRGKVIEKIVEACKNPVGPVLFEKGRYTNKYILSGLISEQMLINVVISESGKIITAYPVLSL